MSRKSVFLATALSMVLTVTVAPACAADTYKVLHWFTGKNGGDPAADLTFDSAGNLYGTTAGAGGSHDCGAVFKLAPAGGGKWTGSVLHYFGLGNEGCQPYAKPVLDAAGNLYATTSFAGAYGGGTIFKLSEGGNGQWIQTVLYSFCPAPNCVDGAEPHASLVFDTAGNLYGTTVGGGAFGEGVVFQLTPGANGQWSETVLYSFCSASGCSDGSQPLAGLVFDTAGNLYGTTSVGGDNYGTVFELAPAVNGQWTETVLHSFNFVDGANPVAGVILDAAGNVYGTTESGGVQSCSGGCGAVFQLSPGTNGQWTETALYNFCSAHKCKDGANPTANLTFDAAGNLLGTTSSGGYCGGCGTVFKLSPGANGQWTETVLRLFGAGAQPKGPFGGVILDTAGNLYGTAEVGGIESRYCPVGCGAVFEITP
jgi:uncharacterized repeat protein (TIGR03803 family)